MDVWHRHHGAVMSPPQGGSAPKCSVPKPRSSDGEDFSPESLLRRPSRVRSLIQGWSRILLFGSSPTGQDQSQGDLLARAIAELAASSVMATRGRR